MTQLFNRTKTAIPRQTIRSKDFNDLQSALIASFNNLGAEPPNGYTGVNSTFHVLDATDDNHAVTKRQHDTGVSAVSANALAAAVSEANAAISESNAAASDTSAAAYAAQCAVLWDQFDDLYLGSKTGDPTLDNDGDPLAEGQLYWNSTIKAMYVYNGVAWAPFTGETALSLLGKLKTVDGTGSGLDADLVRGQDPGEFAQRNQNNVFTGTNTFNDELTVNAGIDMNGTLNMGLGGEIIGTSAHSGIYMERDMSGAGLGGLGANTLNIRTPNIAVVSLDANDNSGDTAAKFIVTNDNDTKKVLEVRADGLVEVNGNTIWHAGNDGVGSGLNAGVFADKSLSEFALKADANTFTNAQTISTTSPALFFHDNNAAVDSKYLKLQGDDGNLYVRFYNDTKGSFRNAYRIARSGYNVGDHTWYTGAGLLSMTLDDADKSLNVVGPIKQNGTDLDAKYLGITAKAADADKLDGIDSTGYARVGTTTVTDTYLYLRRASNIPFYVNQRSTGDIARFFVGSTDTAVSGTSQVTLTNTGGVKATDAVEAVKQLRVERSATPSQYITIDQDLSVSTAGAINSHSSTSNAKSLTIGATTNTSNTTPTGGACNIFFRTLGVDRMRIYQGGAVDFYNDINVTGDVYASGTKYVGDGKEMLRFSDGWLRLNPAGSFSSGIYCASSTLRTDGALQVGASGVNFHVTSAGVVTSAGDITSSGQVYSKGNMHAEKQLYVGTTNTGNTEVNFRDVNSALWRSIRWNNGSNYFELENNSSGFYEITTSNRVGPHTAALGVGAVGTYAYMLHLNVSTTVTEGSTHAGTSLKYTGYSTGGSASNLGSFSGGGVGAIATGTWRAMGRSGNGYATTLFLRIA